MRKTVFFYMDSPWGQTPEVTAVVSIGLEGSRNTWKVPVGARETLFVKSGRI